MSKVQPTLSSFLKRSAASISATPASTTEAVVTSTAKTEETAKKLKELEETATVSLTTTTEPAGAVTRSWVEAEIERLPDDNKWKAVLQREALKNKSLITFLQSLSESRKVYPPRNKVFEAFRLCPFDSVKVVVLGQDPYHGVNQAHGLAFSVSHGVAVPPSLKNIFKEAGNDVKAKGGKHGNLECWAKQGVLLLNALLTVEDGTPLAHKGKGWERFTDACISALSKERENLVFMLWGKPAQEKGAMVDRKKHLVLTSSHPSPLGASKTAEPFLGSKHFSKCNNYLKEHGLEEIDWNVE